MIKVIEKLEQKPGINKIGRRIELNELAGYLNINLRLKSKNTNAEYISCGKNLKIKPTDLCLKDKVFYPKLRFGILSPCSYLNIETVNIISSDTKITNK